MYLALILMVICSLVSVFKYKQSKRVKHTVFFCQSFGYDTKPAVVTKSQEITNRMDIAKRLEISKWLEDNQPQEIAKRREDIRAQEIAKRREEYVEWISNCNALFDNKKVAMDQKVCRRTIDSVA